MDRPLGAGELGHRIIVLSGEKCGVLLEFRPNGVLIKSGVVLVQRFSKYLPLRLIFIGQFFFKQTLHIIYLTIKAKMAATRINFFQHANI